eukprot:TRINITY_DN12662_c0_g1_i1.p1 TRINITY_DN12662_c0_g1~~TRINITY_DN12662_c0_g1_i1.p1  ORF type:complete len:262 (+),score=35.69 TRINITY_DN12662_c0_g1_i1:53-838(+)
MPLMAGKRGGYHGPSKGKREVPAKVDPPCGHNDWDNVRIKKGNHSLRCRVCQSQWRVHHSCFSRCIPFLKGRCELGASCPNVHLNQYKEGLADRRKRFGDVVLTGVPEKILSSHGIEPETTPPMDLNSTVPQAPVPLILPKPVGGEPLQRNTSNVSMQSAVSLPSTNSISLHSRSSTVSLQSPSHVYYQQAVSSSALSALAAQMTAMRIVNTSPSPPVTDPAVDDNEGVMQLTDEDLDLMISNLEKRNSQQGTHAFLPYTP